MYSKLTLKLGIYNYDIYSNILFTDTNVFHIVKPRQV